jgi:hypothetical protein
MTEHNGWAWDTEVSRWAGATPDGRTILWRSGPAEPPAMTPAEATEAHTATYGRGHACSPLPSVRRGMGCDGGHPELGPMTVACTECGAAVPLHRDGQRWTLPEASTAYDEMTGRDVPVCGECAPMLRLATPEQIAAELAGPATEHLAGAWYPEYGYAAPECIGLCGRPSDAGQRLYDEMFGEWQPACAGCVADRTEDDEPSKPRCRVCGAVAEPDAEVCADHAPEIEYEPAECTCPVNRSLQAEHSRGCAAAPSGSF